MQNVNKKDVCTGTGQTTSLAVADAYLNSLITNAGSNFFWSFNLKEKPGHGLCDFPDSGDVEDQGAGGLGGGRRTI